MKTFHLPDLGEGLPEAEIVNWHVVEGQDVKTDDLLVSVETAKAVVEVPSPYTGKIIRLYAKPGDIVETGKPLVDFDVGGNGAAAAPKPKQKTVPVTEDSGTVVGSMPTSDEVLVETVIAGGRRRRKGGRVKAAPAVRALAKKLSVDLSAVPATGRNGLVTADDVRNFQSATPASAEPAPPPAPINIGEAEPLRGPRRAMAQSMSRSRDEIANCTLFDDADINDWIRKDDITVRIIRAICVGVRAEPGLNAFFDHKSTSRRVLEHVDLAMAVDTPDGLIVPVLRAVDTRNRQELRADLNRLKAATRSRTVPREDMKDLSFTLSNFGMMAGRYATPVIVPPTVAILGTGGVRHDVVAVMGGIEVHRRIPLSLTFDHRCVTGGEACRFLAAVIEDLQRTD